MHRCLMLVTVFAVSLAVAFVGGRMPLLAQEATPVGKAVTMSGDITSLQTSFGEVASLPSAPVTIDLYRVQVAPGASLAVAASDPGLGINQVETGTLTLGGFSAGVTVARATGGQEEAAVGTEVALGPGDAFLWLPDVTGEIRNDGTEPASYVAVTIYPVSS